MSDDRATDGPEVPVDGYNAGYAEELYERSLRDRGVVPPSLVEWVEDGRKAAGAAGAPAAPAPEAGAPAAPAERLRLAAVAGSLVSAYRDHGHLAARIDPFESEIADQPLLEPATHGTSRDELSRVPAAVVEMEEHGDTVAEVVDRLREIYCGRIGYELDHIDEPAKRDWLLEQIETGSHFLELDEEDEVALLRRLSEVEGFERFLHRAYMGKKRFSIEGVDMMVPMLDEVVRRAASAETREVILGMAHRGRLNVLAHIIGRPYRQLIAEFEGEHQQGVGDLVPEDGAGDVKYHLGAAGITETEHGDLGVYLAPNPSHLEHVDPVMQGMARAARDLRARGERSRGAGELPRSEGRPGSEDSVLPILIHGDAAFMGQGVVAETLNLHRLEAYETGGTIHVIANNQLGFTTPPEQGRSTRYASDLALGFRIPVIHVNADHPAACLAAARLAWEYRREFHDDILIDLVGYRRYGHNEGDEPSYTQPAMYETIDDHPTVREQWAERLVERGVVGEEEVTAFQDEVADELAEARDEISEAADETSDRAAPNPLRAGLTRHEEEGPVGTAVDEERLVSLNRQLHRWPDDFEPLGKLARQLESRGESLEEGEPLDWAHAEALAFASLVTDGVAVRLSGEDTVRGTFSQRHLRLHDVSGERTYTPLEELEGAEAPFEIWNSPLSEAAAMGFEYGYSAIATESLVLWEAQFGDFANVAQAIIDQFIVSGRSKWGQESRLGLLLPHAYEGQGPEHSSARLERFLQLGGKRNIRVAYPTTPAQYFHLLRLQALRATRRPLVVMTPKSLLRHPGAQSPLGALSGGAFEPVLPEADDSGGAPEGDGEGAGGDASRLLLCSGKVYYDLVGSDLREEADDLALARVELLYPFPSGLLEELIDGLPALEEVVWVQEEPENMGAWSHVRPRLRRLLPEGVGLSYVGRPEMASPAEGYAAHHAREQERIVREALGAGS